MHYNSKRVAIPYHANTVNLQGTLSENYEEPFLQIYQWDKAQFQLINNSQIKVVMVTTTVATKCIICRGLIRRGHAKGLSQVL
jgi:hypothetical protein